MRVVLAAALLAAWTPAAPAADEPTYTVTMDVNGVWGKTWIDAIEASMGRLEGVKSAKKGAKKTQYILKVLETKALTPEDLRKALPDRFDYVAAKIEVSGTIAKDGEAYAFTARASNQKFIVTPNDELKKLLESGKTKVTIAGELDEKEEGEGEKKTRIGTIKVSSARETEEKK